MVMRSASKTARKLTFGEACGFPKLVLRKLFGIFKRGTALSHGDKILVPFSMQRIFPIKALASVRCAVNFGMVADETSLEIGNTVQLVC